MLRFFLPSGLNLNFRKSRFLSLGKKDWGVWARQKLCRGGVLGRFFQREVHPAQVGPGHWPEAPRILNSKQSCARFNKVALFLICPLASGSASLVLSAFSPHLCPLSLAHLDMSLPQGGPPWSPSCPFWAPTAPFFPSHSSHHTEGEGTKLKPGPAASSGPWGPQQCCWLILKALQAGLHGAREC